MTTPYHGNPQGGAPWPPPPHGPWMPPPSGWWPPPPPVRPRRRKQAWLYAVLAVIVIAVAGGVAAIATYEHYQNSDPVKIKALIGAFSDSVSKGNPHEIARLMCREEAEPYLDAVADPGGEPANAPKPRFKIGDVVVHGDAAAATLIFEDHETQTMYFRKNDGAWTVCAPAKDQM